jgi:4-hydroxy-tetrahydrodipicolinate synthase
MDKEFFSGVCTALVTPFTDQGIQENVLEQLLETQIAAGVPAVVLSGTTGESATLTDKEKAQLFAASVEIANGRCKIVAGTGSNDTAHGIKLSQIAQDAGVDGLLVVTPYYNKATADGLTAHYSAIANAVDLPLIVYNVPSRTGVDVPVQVYKELSRVPNIVGVKEACGNISKIVKFFHDCPKTMALWSGNDDQIVPIMALGGRGVISVLSNIAPKETVELVDAALHNDYPRAAQLQTKLLPVIDCLFATLNPIPVKAALQLQGCNVGPCRLPLTSLPAKDLAVLQKTMEETGLL